MRRRRPRRPRPRRPRARSGRCTTSSTPRAAPCRVPDLVGHAGELGLDTARVEEELGSGAHAGRVQRDVDSGESSGVSGTPAFFVNGRLHEGSFDAG